MILLISSYQTRPQIEIRWETESEINTAGFNILRSETPEGTYVRLNKTIIPAADDPIAGASYEFIDADVQLDRVYYYRLEDVEYDNSTEVHEVIEAEAAGRSWWLVLLTIACFIIGIILVMSTLLPNQNRLREN